MKLSRVGSALRFCYEGRTLRLWGSRQLTLARHECVVVAPSLIPRNRRSDQDDRPPGRDQPAKLHRAGELTAVWVPDPAHEAIRDLVRARRVIRGLRGARRNSLAFSCVMAITTIGRRGH